MRLTIKELLIPAALCGSVVFLGIGIGRRMSNEGPDLKDVYCAVPMMGAETMRADSVEILETTELQLVMSKEGIKALYNMYPGELCYITDASTITAAPLVPVPDTSERPDPSTQSVDL